MENKYGRLTIISLPYTKNGHTRVMVECECGNTKEVRLAHLKTGLTKSCGCFSLEQKKLRSTTHGLSHKHPLYSVWNNMKNRCYNKNVEAFKDYGGRGITVCDEWMTSFETFYKWCIANGWDNDLKLDRQNNDGNYEPSNCRFVTAKENCRNKRGTLTLEQVNEIRNIIKSKTIKSYRIAELYGKSPSTISAIASGQNWTK